MGVKVGVVKMVTGVQVEVGLKVMVKVGVAEPVGVLVAVTSWKMVTGAGAAGLELGEQEPCKPRKARAPIIKKA